MNLFVKNLFTDPITYFSTVVAFVGSICFHEFCHATVAHHLGDDTARNSGFQTLNPFKVMGWKSLICLFLFGFSWGAVPVMPEDKSRFRRFAVSLAGPLSNFMLILLASALLKMMRVSFNSLYSVEYLWNFILCVLYANAVLFLFNILPIPPLDGWNAIEPVLPKSLIPSPATKSRIFMVFIYLVCFKSATSGILDKGIDALCSRFIPKPNAVESLVMRGSECLESGNYSEACQAFAQAAEQGSVEGRLLLAQCLVEGWACEPDPERAFAEFSKDEFSVYPLARFYHGLMLALGIGCEQDGAKGYELLSQKDVQKNFPAARAIMGMLLSDGNGVKQDSNKAFQLLDDEKVLSAFPVTHYLASLLLAGEGCPKDARRAFSLLANPKVYEEASAARFLLGICYYAGEGVGQDFKKAAEHIKAAADAGCDDAMEFLGYQDGQFVDYGLPLDELLEQMWAENEANNAAESAK